MDTEQKTMDKESFGKGHLEGFKCALLMQLRFLVILALLLSLSLNYSYISSEIEPCRKNQERNLVKNVNNPKLNVSVANFSTATSVASTVASTTVMVNSATSVATTVAPETVMASSDNNCTGSQMSKAVDCADVLQMGHNVSGVYKIWPMNRLTEGKPLYVYCDMVTDNGGWTVIQRRGNSKTPIDYFSKNWQSYKEGFGDIKKDFWLGNDNIFALTNQKLSSVRFEMKDVQQSEKCAIYDKFWIDDETHKYTLHLSDYSGYAADSMLIARQNNQPFTTKDQDNDSFKDVNCAAAQGGGWWYGPCHHSNLNGVYYKGRYESYVPGFRGLKLKVYSYTLDWTEIKIRPKNFAHSGASMVTTEDQSRDILNH